MWETGGSSTYPLGTDKVGRDILSRIIYGARVSLRVSLGGYCGQWIHWHRRWGLWRGTLAAAWMRFIMRLVDISLGLPIILVGPGVCLGAAFGPSLATLVTVITVLLWARYARQVRGETLEYQGARLYCRARVAGASHLRIMFRYLLPNVVNTLIVLATLQVGFVILLESSLSFLGSGCPASDPAWGLMVADGRELIVTAWWISMFPGLAIMLTVLSLNLVGDWLRDHLDPKLKNI